jgi:hypothetical protein
MLPLLIERRLPHVNREGFRFVRRTTLGRNQQHACDDRYRE